MLRVNGTHGVGSTFGHFAFCQFDCAKRNPTIADFRTEPANLNGELWTYGHLFLKWVLLPQSGRPQEAPLKGARAIPHHCKSETRNPKHETKPNDPNTKF